MAVIVKYVVVRDGDEKMTFATKKEADAHDKMLDIADALYQFFKDEKMELNDEQMDDLSLCLAKNKDLILQLLKGGKLPGSGKAVTAKKTGTTTASSSKTGKKETKKTDGESKTDEITAPDEGKSKKTKTGKQKKTA